MMFLIYEFAGIVLFMKDFGNIQGYCRVIGVCVFKVLILVSNVSYYNQYYATVPHREKKYVNPSRTAIFTDTLIPFQKHALPVTQSYRPYTVGSGALRNAELLQKKRITLFVKSCLCNHNY